MTFPFKGSNQEQQAHYRVHGFSSLVDAADVDARVQRAKADGFKLFQSWPFGARRFVLGFEPDPNWNPTATPIAG